MTKNDRKLKQVIDCERSGVYMNIFENITNIGTGFSGKDPGNMMYWYLDEEGTLYISGKGKMADYSCSTGSTPPWQEKKDLIQTLVLDEGITETGANAFESCGNLSRAVLPSSINKIHYCCFKNCRNLQNIESAPGVEYRFLYEPASEDRKIKNIRFGIHAFYGTPWAMEKWGDFYIRDRVLLAYLAVEDVVVIPDNVKAVGVFAFKDLPVVSVEFPEGLRRIEALAFDSSGLRRVILPESIEYIGPSAFRDSAVETVLLPYKAKAEINETAFRGTCIPFTKRMSVHMPEAYELVLRSGGKQFEGFQRLTVREKRVKKASTPEKEGYFGTISLRAGDSLVRRLKNRSTVIGIACDAEEKKVISIRSFKWNREKECIAEYVMYPCYKEGDRDKVGERKSSLTYIKEDMIKRDFFSDRPDMLTNGNDIRYISDSEHEEWFWSRGKGGFGGEIERKLLESWLRVHTDYSLDGADRSVYQMGD